MMDESRSEPRKHTPATSGTTRLAILREAQTAIGEVQLRRRWSLALERDVYEILVDHQLMMSSAIHESEDALAERALAATDNADLKVLIGGFGLGFTALKALADQRVSSVTVMELLTPLIQWHRDGILPWSEELFRDPRFGVVEEDFFSFITRPSATDTEFDLVLIDIDDSPDDLWHTAHADFYSTAGLEAAVGHLRPEGVLAFWFAIRPSEAFLERLHRVLDNVQAEPLRFYDPSLHEEWEHFLVWGNRRP